MKTENLSLLTTQYLFIFLFIIYLFIVIVIVYYRFKEIRKQICTKFIVLAAHIHVMQVVCIFSGIRVAKNYGGHSEPYLDINVYKIIN